MPSVNASGLTSDRVIISGNSRRSSDAHSPCHYYIVGALYSCQSFRFWMLLICATSFVVVVLPLFQLGFVGNPLDDSSSSAFTVKTTDGSISVNPALSPAKLLPQQVTSPNEPTATTPMLLSIKRQIRVGILIMATGRYASFTRSLVSSARRYLLNDDERPAYKVTFFIFTDNIKDAAKGDDIVFIHQPRLGWPSDTLWRCSAYLNSTDLLLKSSDYLFSLDADMMIAKPIGPEILGDLVGTLHPGYYASVVLPFERRMQSCAQVPYNQGTHYFAGGVFGGRTQLVVQMCEAMHECILKDLGNNVTATWHDESHLNHYFTIVQPPTLILSPAYCYPQEKTLPYEAKIWALQKPHAAMREADPLRRK